MSSAIFAGWDVTAAISFQLFTRKLFSNLQINLLAGREKFSYKEVSRNLTRHSHQLAEIARMELPRQTRG